MMIFCVKILLLWIQERWDGQIRFEIWHAFVIKKLRPDQRYFDFKQGSKLSTSISPSLSALSSIAPTLV